MSMKFPSRRQGAQHDFDHLQGHGGGIDVLTPQRLWEQQCYSQQQQQGHIPARTGNNASTLESTEEPDGLWNQQYQPCGFETPYTVLTNAYADVQDTAKHFGDWCESEREEAERDAVTCLQAKQLLPGEYIPFAPLYDVVKEDREIQENDKPHFDFSENAQRMLTLSMSGSTFRQLLLMPGGKHFNVLILLYVTKDRAGNNNYRIVPDAKVDVGAGILELLCSSKVLKEREKTTLLVRTHGTVHVISLELENNNSTCVNLQLLDCLDFSKCTHGMPVSLCWCRLSWDPLGGSCTTTDEVIFGETIAFFVNCFDGTLFLVKRSGRESRVEKVGNILRVVDTAGGNNVIHWKLLNSPWPNSVFVMTHHDLQCVRIIDNNTEIEDRIFRRLRIFSSDPLLGAGEADSFSCPVPEYVSSCVVFLSIGGPVCLIATSERILLVNVSNQTFFSDEDSMVSVGTVVDERKQPFRTTFIDCSVNLRNERRRGMSPVLLCDYILTTAWSRSLSGTLLLSMDTFLGTPNKSTCVNTLSANVALWSNADTNDLSTAIFLSSGTKDQVIRFPTDGGRPGRGNEQRHPRCRRQWKFTCQPHDYLCSCRKNSRVISSCLIVDDRTHNGFQLTLDAGGNLIAVDLSLNRLGSVESAPENHQRPIQLHSAQESSGTIVSWKLDSLGNMHIGEDISVSNKGRGSFQTPKGFCESAVKSWFHAANNYVSRKHEYGFEYCHEANERTGMQLEELVECCMVETKRGLSLSDANNVLANAGKVKPRANRTDPLVGSWNLCCCGKGKLILGKSPRISFDASLFDDEGVHTRVESFLKVTFPRLFHTLSNTDHKALRKYAVPILSFPRKRKEFDSSAFWEKGEQKGENVWTVDESEDYDLRGILETESNHPLSPEGLCSLSKNGFLFGNRCVDKLWYALSQFLEKESEVFQLIRGIAGYSTRTYMGVFPSLSEVLRLSLDVDDADCVLHPQRIDQSLTSLFAKLDSLPGYILGKYKRKCIHLSWKLTPILQSATNLARNFLADCFSALLCGFHVVEEPPALSTKKDAAVKECAMENGLDFQSMQQEFCLDHKTMVVLKRIIYKVYRQRQGHIGRDVGIILPETFQQVAFLMCLVLSIIATFLGDNVKDTLSSISGQEKSCVDIPTTLHHWIECILLIEKQMYQVFLIENLEENIGDSADMASSYRTHKESFSNTKNARSRIVLKYRGRQDYRKVFQQSFSLRYFDLAFNMRMNDSLKSILPLSLAVEAAFTSQKTGGNLPPSGVSTFFYTSKRCSSKTNIKFLLKRCICSGLRKEVSASFSELFSWHNALSEYYEQEETENVLGCVCACFEDFPIYIRRVATTVLPLNNIPLLDFSNGELSSNASINNWCSGGANCNIEANKSIREYKRRSVSTASLVSVQSHILTMLQIPHTLFSITMLLRQKFGHHINERLVEGYLRELERDKKMFSFRQDICNGCLSFSTSTVTSIEEMESHLEVFCSSSDFSPNDMNFIDMSYTSNKKRNFRSVYYEDAVGLFAEERKAKRQRQQARTVEKREAIATGALQGLYDQKPTPQQEEKDVADAPLEDLQDDRLLQKIANYSSDRDVEEDEWLVATLSPEHNIPFILSEFSPVTHSGNIGRQARSSSAGEVLGKLSPRVNDACEHLSNGKFGAATSIDGGNKLPSSRIGRLRKSKEKRNWVPSADYIVERQAIEREHVEKLLDEWDEFGEGELSEMLNVFLNM